MSTSFWRTKHAAHPTVMGATSALIVTVPDLTRYAKSPRSQVWQMVGLPLAQTLCATFGILATSAVYDMWQVQPWNPVSLLSEILDRSWTPGARAAVFFASFSFAFACLGTSIACNIIPFAADVTCLLPRFMSVVRGQVACLILAVAVMPWRIIGSASGFLRFLGAYTIFMGSVVSMMLVDYHVLRRGNVDISELFNVSSQGKYWFRRGCNLRALVAFVVGLSLPLPGVICSIFKLGPLPIVMVRFADFGWLLSFTMGGVTYFILATLAPSPYVDDSKLKREEMASLGQDYMAEIVPVDKKMKVRQSLTAECGSSINESRTCAQTDSSTIIV